MPNTVTEIPKEVERLAYTDYLTDLVNRRGLYLYYNELPKDSSLHFMFIDIDNFKRVNDVYGHSMGDKLLIEVSNLIRSKIPTGFVSRIGGDEFVVVINGEWTTDEVTSTAQSIIDDLNSIDFRQDILSLISLSVGIILDQSTSIMLDDILYKCDSAMYTAKSSGKNQYIIYQSNNSTVETAKNIESEMESALANNEFQVYLQPITNMITSKLIGAEALTRWIHPVDGMRLPEMFIPLFEKNGFIMKLDLYIFEKVCEIKSRWKGHSYEKLVVSINFSRLHLYIRDLPDKLTSIAAKYNIPTNELQLEFSENVFIKDGLELINMVKKLRDCGFLVAIDNFGSGYSPLSMLKDLPVDYIKLDRTFLQMSADNSRGQKVFQNIVSMCKDLRLNIVTEGIETQEQVDFVTNCGCDIAQGFFYSESLPVKDFRLYAKKHCTPNDAYIKFSFNNTLNSDCEKYKCCFVGEGLEYSNGPIDDMHSIYFPGGPQGNNLLMIPNNVLYNESYTISMWLKPVISHTWTSALYVDYQNGFMSFTPFAWEGHSSYRIRDRRIANGYFDTAACHVWENAWTHVVIAYNYITEKTFLYINGIPSGQLTNVPSLFSIKKIMLGGDIYQDSYHGYISDLYIFNDVKTPTEITELFEAVHSHPSFDVNR